MFIQFTHKGISYRLPLIINPNISSYNSLAVIKFPDDDKPSLQLVSTGYTPEHLIKVKNLSVMTTEYHPEIGRVLLSRSYKRAWLNDGYCHRIKEFIIID